MFNEIGQALANTASKVKFGFDQNKSTICFCGGLAAGALALFLTGRASFKLHDVITEVNEQIEDIENSGQDEEQIEKDIRKTRGGAILQIAKLYIPPVVAGGASVALLTYSKHTDVTSIAGLSAYALAIEHEFDEYRTNVKNRFGEEVDKQLRFNINPDTALPAADGDISNDVQCTTLAKETQYEGTKRFYFDKSTSAAWEPNAMYNLKFADIACHTANEMLRARGHLWVNEALDILEMDRIPEGFDVGWIYDPNVEYKIDFGIYHRILEDNDEPSFWIEFNHDGRIRSRVYGEGKVAKNA